VLVLTNNNLLESKYKALSRCVACDSERLKPLLDLVDQPLANSFHIKDEPLDKFPLAVNRCIDCNHIQLTVAVSPDLLFEEYAYVSGTTTTLIKYFNDYADLIEKKFNGAKLNILDIACNDGSLLAVFKERGHKVLGVDPAKNLRKISEQNGIDVIVDYWSESIAEKYKDSFDLIIAQNVLAHVSVPMEFLKAAYTAIKPSGLISIQTSQYFMLKNGEFDTIYHEHHSFFCLKSFSRLAKRCFLNVVDAQHANIHGGSMVWYLSKTNNLMTDNYKKLHDEEVTFINEVGFRKFKENSTAFKIKLNALCDEHLEKGYKIIGYGAAAKGNTVLNYCQIKLEYIIDDNPIKQGKFTPGLDIAVVPALELKNTSESLLIIIFAWNFAVEIRERIKRVRNNPNDKFLVYFPTFKFVE
jgi:2-polyprenyl-3-methyl-5-hydroxy-6-metoxy-1,4-benzoquinol methylase